MYRRTRLYVRGGTALAVSVPSKYNRTNSNIAPTTTIPLILSYVRAIYHLGVEV